MPIVSNELVYEEPNGSRFDVQYKYVDHLGGEYYQNKLVPAGTDHNAAMLAHIPILEARLAESEVLAAINSAEGEQLDYSIAPNHQTKQEYIRRVLGGAMQIQSVDHYNNFFQFFLDFETDQDTGNNAPQRSSYLGIDQSTYQLIEQRFNSLAGVQSFINDEKGRVWEDGYPDGYW
jgi:hypothetical protein